MKYSIKTLYILVLLLVCTKTTSYAQSSCDGDQLILTTMSSGTTHAATSITTSAIIDNGMNITLKAGTSITLTNGFHTKAGSIVSMSIEACTTTPPNQGDCVTPDETIWDNPWTSCSTSANPNSSRGNGHWIQYDLGTAQKLGKMHVWNINQIGQSNKGFKEVIIDYSLNGSSWTQLTTTQFPRGTEEALYGGFAGADFNGISARYVLITAVSNWGANDCSGLTEVKFNIAPIPAMPTSGLVAAPTAAISATSIRPRIKTFNIFPNPASTQTNLFLESAIDQPAQIVIVNLMGKIVQRFEVALVKGDNFWTFPIEHLVAGSYFVTITTAIATTYETKKLMVTRQ